MASSKFLNRFSRGNFYGSVVDPNGRTIIDPINFSFSEFYNFIKDKEALIHRVTEDQEAMPDLISFINYNSENYWWIICFINKISDPLTELPPGKILGIPLLNDIEEYFQIQRSKNNSNGQIVNI